MFRAASPLVVLVLLAGCLGGADPETPAAATPNVQAAGSGATATGTTATLAANETNASVVIPVATPVSYSGKTPAGACVFMAGVCQFPQGGTEDYHMLDPIAGQAKTLALQVTYGEQAPGMTFYVGVCMGEDEGAECLDYQTGPSPLVVEFDLSGYPPGTAFGISVGSLNEQAINAGVLLDAPVDFEVAGTLTSIPPA